MKAVTEFAVLRIGRSKSSKIRIMDLRKLREMVSGFC